MFADRRDLFFIEAAKADAIFQGDHGSHPAHPDDVVNVCNVGGRRSPR
jgi:hypothetical protein